MLSILFHNGEEKSKVKPLYIYIIYIYIYIYIYIIYIYILKCLNDKILVYRIYFKNKMYDVFYIYANVKLTIIRVVLYCLLFYPKKIFSNGK